MTGVELRVQALVKWAIAAVVSIWLSIPVAVQTLLVVTVIDYATGVLCAYIERKVSSQEGRNGLARKTAMLLLVITAYYVTRPLHLGFEFGTWVATAFAFNELISITENCHRAGVPIPQPLIDRLMQARKLVAPRES